jgi:hypothetical protein
LSNICPWGLEAHARSTDGSELGGRADPFSCTLDQSGGDTASTASSVAHALAVCSCQTIHGVAHILVDNGARARVLETSIDSLVCALASKLRCGSGRAGKVWDQRSLLGRAQTALTAVSRCAEAVGGRVVESSCEKEVVTRAVAVQYSAQNIDSLIGGRVQLGGVEGKVSA